MDTTKKEKLTSLILALIIIVLLLLSVGYFANKYFGFLPQRIKINNPISSKDSQSIQTGSKLENGYLFIPAQILVAPITRFTVDIGPKQIGSITARLKFKPGPKEIKLGIRGSVDDRFIYHPFYQKLLQDCDWGRVESSGILLYQRSKNYDSLAKLVEVPPDKSKIASYFIDESSLIQKNLGNGLDLEQVRPVSIKTGLRGTHAFIVRVDRIPFIFKIYKQDLNQYKGEDKLLVSISKNGRLIEKKTIPDDGFTGTENLRKEPQSAEFKFDKVDPGDYEILAKSDSYGGDTIITSIETNQSKMVIANNVFPLYDKPVTLYTNSSPITIRAVHTGSVQTVKLNDDIPLALQKSGTNYVFDLKKLVPDKKTSEPYKLETPNTDVVFNSLGNFAFSPEQYFSSEIINTTDLNTVDSLDQVDYILTSAKKAKKEGDWLVSEVAFDGKDINMDDNRKLYFSLEMPNLQKGNSGLEIESFEVEVSTPGIFLSKLGQNNAGKSTVENKLTTTTELGTFPKNISSFFSEIYRKVTSFFVGSFSQIFHTNKQQAKSASQSPILISRPTLTLSPAPTTSPGPTPTPTPTLKTNLITVKVLNGGALSGTAGKFVETLKSSGFINASAGNIDSQTYKNASLRYRSVDKSVADQIAALLAKDYPIIDRGEGATTSAEIVVILGAK